MSEPNPNLGAELPPGPPGGPTGSMVLGMCTYNRGRKIEHALEAVAAMDRLGGRVTRLVIIDNNSTDETGAVIDRFAGMCDRIEISRVVETRQGQSFARERLARETFEPIIAFLDDDVLLDPAWAREVFDVLDRRPEAHMVGGRVELRYESGPTPEALRCAKLLASQDWGEHERCLDHPKDFLVGAAFAIRRDALERSGWLTDRLLGGRAGGALGSGDDYEIGLRVRKGEGGDGGEGGGGGGGRGGELWYTPRARCTHLIAASRQTPEYLANLTRGVSRSEPFIQWLQAGEPDEEWVLRKRRRARQKLLRTRLLEWRPRRRAQRLLERTARLEGWNTLLAHVRAHREERPAALPGA